MGFSFKKLVKTVTNIVTAPITYPTQILTEKVIAPTVSNVIGTVQAAAKGDIAAIATFASPTSMLAANAPVTGLASDILKTTSPFSAPSIENDKLRVITEAGYAAAALAAPLFASSIVGATAATGTGLSGTAGGVITAGAKALSGSSGSSSEATTESSVANILQNKWFWIIGSVIGLIVIILDRRGK